MSRKAAIRVEGIMDDAAIVAGLRAGDPEALGFAFQKFRRPIRSYAARGTGSMAVADEILQETFLRLARHGRDLRPDSKIAAWLFAVARNLVRSHRRWSWLDGDRLAALAKRAVARPARPDELHEAGDALNRMADALDAMPTSEREAAWLSVVDGLDPADAAAVLGVTPEAARRRLSRARARLRDALKEDP